MDLELRGRTFVVSGASSGIGLATARRLLGEGANVCGFARDLDRLRGALTSAADTAGAADGGSRLLLRAGDARVPAEVDSIVAAAADAFGGVDGVVANTGTGVAAGVGAEPAVWREQFDTKIVAAIALIESARSWLARARGVIVLVNGVTAHHPDPQMAPVGAARAALANYAASLGAELASVDVRVVAVNVGVIATERQRARHLRSGSPLDYDEWRVAEARRRGIPLGRMGRPEEVADTIAFLLSPRSAYTTGTSIDIAGGLDGRT
ncbi:SDR family oxidoreductase [Tsukamurella sp. NPDC003166]|uniref:SDR family oxidoreductase n=1 Tax=Tsukamurella sp. NPDC003166 TaxID=3154444 RepID=UPI0033BE59B4